MASLDHIIDRVREDAGADFAFILTRRGRLVTKSAPPDMPEPGRTAIVAVAEQLVVTRRAFAHTELPREALVPFGGAAPVDVYVAVRDEAILCVVMATFRRQDRVGPAVAWGVQEVDALLDTEGQRRMRRRGLKGKPPNPKSSSGGKRRRTGEFSLDFDDDASPRGTAPFLTPYRPVSRSEMPPPEISITEAKVGRATMAAIEVDAESPDIVYGMAPVGRHTFAEIERSEMPQGDPKSSIPELRVDIVSMPSIDRAELDVVDRQTLPFTENPATAKRIFDAKNKAAAEKPVTLSQTPQRTVIVGRSSYAKIPRRLTKEDAPDIRIEDAGDREMDTIPDETTTVSEADVELVVDGAAGADAPAAPPPSGLPIPSEPPRPGTKKSDKPSSRGTQRPKAGRPLASNPFNIRDSNIEAWHQALGEIETDPSSKNKPAPEGEASPSSQAESAKESGTKPRTRPPSAAFPKRRQTPPPSKRRD